MRYEWDEKKRLANLGKHKIDFADVPEVFRNETITILDDRFDYKEERFVTFGLLQGRVVSVVHTEDDEVIRIISVRKATKNEQKFYFQNVGY